MITRAAIAAALAAVLSPGLSSAQTLEVQAIQSRSGYDVLSSPTGVGMTLVSRPRGHFAFRAGYSYRRDGETGPGRACTGLVAPGQDCPLETMEEEFDLHLAQAGVAIVAPLSGGSEARVSVLGTYPWLDGKSTGRETGRSIRPHEPEAHLGWILAVDGRWVPARWESLGMTAGLAVETPLAGACATDSWVPFCGRKPIFSLTAGLSWRFGGGATEEAAP